MLTNLEYSLIFLLVKYEGDSPFAIKYNLLGGNTYV